MRRGPPLVHPEVEVPLVQLDDVSALPQVPVHEVAGLQAVHRAGCAPVEGGVVQRFTVQAHLELGALHQVERLQQLELEPSPRPWVAVVALVIELAPLGHVGDDDAVADQLTRHAP